MLPILIEIEKQESNLSIFFELKYIRNDKQCIFFTFCRSRRVRFLGGEEDGRNNQTLVAAFIHRLTPPPTHQEDERTLACTH